MKLHRITITNFRSFKGEQTFRFPEEPGLYFMQGINEVEPRLEGNATGKSTIWEALLWCRFGKTSRGLKAGDICNWEVSKGTRVELAYQTEDAVSLKVMTRTWGPNTWTLQDLFGNVIDLTDDNNSQIATDFGLDFAPFLNSILMAQSQPMFMDLRAEAQATMFAEVLNLDCWLEYSASAGRKAGKHDLEIRRLERDQSTLTGELEGHQDFGQQIDDFQNNQATKLADIEARHAAGVKQLQELKDDLENAMVAEDAARETLAKNQDVLDAAVLTRDESVKGCTKLERAKQDANLRREPSQTLLEFLMDHKHCPTCDQDIDPNDKRKKLIKVKAELTGLDSVFNEAGLALKLEKGRLEKIEQKVTRLMRNHDDFRTIVRDLENEVKRARLDLAIKERYLDSLEEQARAVLNEVNPFQELHQMALEHRRGVLNRLRDTQILLDRENEAYSLANYWIKGFKEVRLHLIAEALTELEIEVNSSVTALGLVGWELKFQVDRETKSGGISRGFSVNVISPSNPRPVPWASWSGGESQRLRIAGNMGMANLIRSRFGTQLNLEVWDEPSTALSPQGVQDLLEALRHRAKTEKRVIWVVDHTAYNFGGFTGGATITKSENGSAVEIY